ncbi:hypothetical protein WMF31_06430 [Sorangium sp. So ce1036]|uniref:hypothetical protein n=1 Tax=Sorangium sp. So ce1036 TaxID=3133328 RepID=UPI003F07B902
MFIGFHWIQVVHMSRLSFRGSSMILRRRPDWRNLASESAALALGVELFRSVANDRRPAWVGGMLKAVIAAARCDVMGFGEKMVMICEDKYLWGTAESLFYDLRRVSLNAKFAGSPVERALVDLLEVSAKVVCNASGVVPGFDAHAGARILPLVVRIARLVEQEPGREEALRLVDEALWSEVQRC